MRIMVTGADGYIGQGVVSQLLGEGHEVIAMGFRPCGIEHARLEERVGDAFTFDFESC